MKYFDKNTIKSVSNWHKKQFDNDEDRNRLKEINRLKKKLKIFSYKIDDKIWWNSLLEKDKINAYFEYINGCQIFWYSSSASQGLSGMSGALGNPESDDVSTEEHERRISYLKDKYKPKLDRRRNLVIESILK